MTARVGIAPDIGPDGRVSVASAYPDALRRAGGEPVELSPEASRPLDDVGALLLCGGAFDIPPEWYGAAPRGRVDSPREERSRFERRLLREAERSGLPILGICGGAQLLAVHRGGTLVQDIATECPDAVDHEQGSRSSQAVHPVRLSPQSRLARLVGATEIAVNSTHHQSVAQPGSGVRAVGWAPDGVVEAIEDPSLALWIGVQWHPEKLAEPHADALLRSLIRAAEAHRPA